MKMITQTTDANEARQQAKQNYLDNQRRAVVERLKSSNADERAATVRHINGFLPVTTPPDAVRFWQSVRADILAIDEMA